MLVYEQAGSAYMRFNCKQPAMGTSLLVRLQEQAQALMCSPEKLDQLEEARTSMGASIENLHLQAALLSRMKHLNKCSLI